MIAHDANINKKDASLSNNICIPEYPTYCSAPLLTAVKTGSLSIIQLLLKSGADINITAFDGTTPLMLACQENAENVIRLLLENNADPNLQMNDGTTALLIAFKKRNLLIINHLIQHKARIIGAPELESTIEGTVSQDLCMLLLDRGVDHRTLIGPSKNPFLVDLTYRIKFGPQITLAQDGTNPPILIRMILSKIVNNRTKAVTIMCVFNQRKNEPWAKLLYTHGKDLIKKHILAILYLENQEQLRLALNDKESENNERVGIIKRQNSYDLFKYDILNPDHIETTMKQLWIE